LAGVPQGFWAGDQRLLARVISLVEDEMPEKDDVLRQLHEHTGHGYILGFTGSPGAGKSSLVDSIIREIRKRNQTVGVIAVDPSSPFSGGAFLGDRIRMNEHAMDEGVFVRSMATRGSLGGLAKTTKEVVKVMDAFGMDWIIIETVGVGQSELDIMYIADTTIVVLTPGAGDSIQSMKAGIMEIADIFAINKCDMPGADTLSLEVNIMLDMQDDHIKWRPPVMLTSNLHKAEGVVELLDAIETHRNYLNEKGLFAEKRRERTKNETLDIVNHQWQRLVHEEVSHPGTVNELLAKVAAREVDPYTAASKIMDRIIADQKKA
jgi:LAO/AO transport system kinase